VTQRPDTESARTQTYANLSTAQGRGQDQMDIQIFASILGRIRAGQGDIRAPWARGILPRVRGGGGEGYYSCATGRVGSLKSVGLPDERCSITEVLVCSKTELVAVVPAPRQRRVVITAAPTEVVTSQRLVACRTSVARSRGSWSPLRQNWWPGTEAGFDSCKPS
jgi:hypothetical protein